MAVWQVALHYVKAGNNIDYSSSVFISSVKKIEEFFPQTKSWCKTIKQYGALDATCIEIDTDNDEISVRIDLRNISEEQLQVLINFAVENGLFIKYKDVLYEPSADTLTAIFRESDANKFIMNPEKFLATECACDTLMFPDILDGAKVLFFSPKGDYGYLYDTEGNAVAHFSYLAICKYNDGEGYYLFKCNDNFEVETDSLWDSIQMCIRCADNLCGKKIVWAEKK